MSDQWLVEVNIRLFVICRTVFNATAYDIEMCGGKLWICCFTIYAKHYSYVIWMLQCLKSSGTWTFVQKVFETDNEKINKVLYYSPFVKVIPLITGGLASQRASNAENISSSWRHHNSSPLSAAYMRPWTGSPLVQIMACRLFGTKPLSKPMLVYCQLDP